MKIFVNPLLFFFIIQSLVLIFLYSCYWDGLDSTIKLLCSILFCSILGLILLSLPLTKGILESSLAFAPNSKDKVLPPKYIIVLGSGFHQGSILEEDYLDDVSYGRVLRGVSVWHRYPTAKLIVSGASLNYPFRSPDRMVQLMANVAASAGVPRIQIIKEPRALNTRQHPLEVLKFPEITYRTPIAIVTSPWHMRRAKQEFGRYFTRTQYYPVIFAPTSLTWQSFIPDAGALRISTRYIKEWVGLVWYALVAKLP